MGLAVSQARMYTEYGGADGAKHGTELLTAVKTKVGSAKFQKNSAVYTQVCKTLGKCSDSTVDDVIKMANTAITNSKNSSQAASNLRTVNMQISNLLSSYSVKDFPTAKMQELVEAGLTWNSNPKTGYSSFAKYAADYISKYAKENSATKDNGGIDENAKQALSDQAKAIDDLVNGNIDKTENTFSDTKDTNTKDSDTSSKQKTIDENIEKAINAFSNSRISLKGKLVLPNNAYTRSKFN